MAITKKLKEDMKVYNINLPTNGRTKEFKKEVNSYGIKELYIAHLRDLVRDAKLTEKKKIATIQKTVLQNNNREDIIKKVQKRNDILKNTYKISAIQLNYLKNKLFYMLPSDSSFKSYLKYTIWNDRPDTIGITNTTEDEVIFNQFSNHHYEPTVLSVEEIQKFIQFYSVMKFLKTQLHHKVWISIDCLTLKHKEISTLTIRSKSQVVRNTSDINDVIQDLYRLYEQQAEQSYN